MAFSLFAGHSRCYQRREGIVRAGAKLSLAPLRGDEYEITLLLLVVV